MAIAILTTILMINIAWVIYQTWIEGNEYDIWLNWGLRYGNREIVCPIPYQKVMIDYQELKSHKLKCEVKIHESLVEIPDAMEQAKMSMAEGIGLEILKRGLCSIEHQRIEGPMRETVARMEVRVVEPPPQKPYTEWDRRYNMLMPGMPTNENRPMGTGQYYML